jgi:hypothetical protein
MIVTGHCPNVLLLHVWHPPFNDGLQGILRSKLLEGPLNASRVSLSTVRGASPDGASLAYINCSVAAAATGSLQSTINSLANHVRRRLTGTEQGQVQGGQQPGCHLLRSSTPFAARQDLVTRHLQDQEQGQSLGQRLWGRLSSGMTGGGGDQLEGVPPEFRFLTDPSLDTPGTW